MKAHEQQSNQMKSIPFYWHSRKEKKKEAKRSEEKRRMSSREASRGDYSVRLAKLNSLVQNNGPFPRAEYRHRILISLQMLTFWPQILYPLLTAILMVPLHSLQAFFPTPLPSSDWNQRAPRCLIKAALTLRSHKQKYLLINKAPLDLNHTLLLQTKHSYNLELSFQSSPASDWLGTAAPL